MARIEIRDFTLKFWGQEHEVLKDINMTFDTSERILLLAPSGQGKSTLLLSLLGIIQRNELGKYHGRILIDGRGIEEMTPQEITRIFGIVFQEPESQFCLLYPDEEVAFALENQSMERDEMKKRVEKALRNVGMERKSEQLLGSMSGGEQQRVAIASSVAMGSSMLLLDEPTSKLDTRGRLEIRDLVSSLDLGFLLVEHNLDEWIEDVDRVVVLGRDGRLAADTTMEALRTKGYDLLESLGIWRPGLKWICGRKERSEVRETLLEVRDLSLEIEGKRILEDVSLDVKGGEIVALLGENGAGKSTLSKVLGRIEEGWQGSVNLSGNDIRGIGMRDYYNEVAYVFQNPEYQFVRDNVEAEIELSLKNFGSREGTEEILKRYRLGRLKKENPFTLSGGEKRRLSIAVMLSEEHRVLILDEPTFGLDYDNARELMGRVEELAKRGMAVMIITHDMELVERYAHRSIVMKAGRKIFEGETESLWEEIGIVRDAGLALPMNRQIDLRKAKEVRAV